MKVIIMIDYEKLISTKCMMMSVIRSNLYIFPSNAPGVTSTVQINSLVFGINIRIDSISIRFADTPQKSLKAKQPVGGIILTILRCVYYCIYFRFRFLTYLSTRWWWNILVKKSVIFTCSKRIVCSQLINKGFSTEIIKLGSFKKWRIGVTGSHRDDIDYSFAVVNHRKVQAH